MILFEDFVLRALIAGIGIAAVSGPLGCFVVWRRMAYFGETMAHAALLGVALGLLFQAPLPAAVAAVGAVLALALTFLRRRGRYRTDTLLGIFAHAALAAGLVTIAFMETVRVDLLAYLFGDILAVTPLDVGLVVGGAAIVLAVVAWIWRPLLSITVNAELAAAEGMPTLRYELGFMFLIAALVAVAIKIVGVLLVTALLVIPAAAARELARTPEAMAIGAAGVGAASVVGGIAGSAYLDLPAGPAIVLVAFLLFVAITGSASLLRR